MKTRIAFLIISYWVGAILDGIMVFPMLFPNIAGAMFGIKDFHPGVSYRYAMFIGASLMLGWTILLAWAARKPLERKGVIIITAVPVVAGLIAANIYAVEKGIVSFDHMLPTLILQALIFILFCSGYIFSFFGKSIK
jgi:hypothetical protein